MSKRMILAVLGALALTLGLVSGPALAGDPYPGTVGTSTSINAPKTVEKGQSAQIAVRVGTRGSGRPAGRVTITVKGPGFAKSVSRAYGGAPVEMSTGRLKKVGTYKVTATFSGGRSVFKDSKDTATFKVVKK